jgi:hypothetical protein
MRMICRLPDAMPKPFKIQTKNQSRVEAVLLALDRLRPLLVLGRAAITPER